MIKQKVQEGERVSHFSDSSYKKHGSHKCSPENNKVDRHNKSAEVCPDDTIGEH